MFNLAGVFYKFKYQMILLTEWNGFKKYLKAEYDINNIYMNTSAMPILTPILA
jgi:hypothetical protein